MNGPLTVRVRIAEVVTDRRLDGDALASAIQASLRAAWRSSPPGRGRPSGRTEFDHVSATAVGHAVDQIGATVASTVVEAVGANGPRPRRGDGPPSSPVDSLWRASS
jgi:hypothetical protein